MLGERPKARIFETFSQPRGVGEFVYLRLDERRYVHQPGQPHDRDVQMHVQFQLVHVESRSPVARKFRYEQP